LNLIRLTPSKGETAIGGVPSGAAPLGCQMTVPSFLFRWSGFFIRRRRELPLPLGEGWGEGLRAARTLSSSPSPKGRGEQVSIRSTT
jgi:hypothetical protein